MRNLNQSLKAALVSAAVLGVATVLLVSCATPEAEKPVVGRISELPPIVYPADNPTSAAKVALGAQLFVDKRLSGNASMSCQGCHYRELGWTHGIAFSQRVDGQTNTRRSPPLYNVGHQSIWYWDGRSGTMEAQTTAAWRNQMCALNKSHRRCHTESTCTGDTSKGSGLSTSWSAMPVTPTKCLGSTASKLELATTRPAVKNWLTVSTT